MSNIKYGIIILIAGVLGALIVSSWPVEQFKLGSAPDGTASLMRWQRPISVGPSNTVVLATKGQCSSRIVTTYANPIMIHWATTTSGLSRATSTTYVNGSRGHLQSASTTQVYDSNVYGCDYMAAYGFGASTTITVTEMQ